jgi:hypothetical protein
MRPDWAPADANVALGRADRDDLLRQPRLAARCCQILWEGETGAKTHSGRDKFVTHLGEFTLAKSSFIAGP